MRIINYSLEEIKISTMISESMSIIRILPQSHLFIIIILHISTDFFSIYNKLIIINHPFAARGVANKTIMRSAHVIMINVLHVQLHWKKSVIMNYMQMLLIKKKNFQCDTKMNITLARIEIEKTRKEIHESFGKCKQVEHNIITCLKKYEVHPITP